MLARIALAASLLLAPLAAHAQLAVQIVPPGSAPGNCSGAIGTTATPLNITSPRNFFMQNVGSTSIGVSWFTATPAIGASGTFTLAPGATLNSTLTGAPGNVAYYAVSSAAGGQLTCSWN